jgi:hypothetical protein
MSTPACWRGRRRPHLLTPDARVLLLAVACSIVLWGAIIAAVLLLSPAVSP